MAEFKRSRLKRQNEEQITKKTVFLGVLTILFIIGILVFGLPLLIKFSVFLGNTKSKSSSDDTEKTLPPLAPRLVIPFEATNSGKINITGFSESKVNVELFKNDIPVGKVDSSENSDFSFQDISLDEGDNNFTAVASTEKNGSSEKSKSLNVVYDKTAPSLNVTNPSEADLTVDYADFDVVGTTDSGVSVYINNRIASVDTQGNFKLRWQLTTGKNTLEVKAVDEAGNETKKTINITFSL